MSDDSNKLPEDLLASILGGQRPKLTKEEIKAKIEEQEMQIQQNFKKLETQDIIRMLVSAENFLKRL